MQSESTPSYSAKTIIYDICHECGQFGPLTRRTEDGLTDEIDQFWLCQTCSESVVYGPEDGVPF